MSNFHPKYTEVEISLLQCLSIGVPLNPDYQHLILKFDHRFIFLLNANCPKPIYSKSYEGRIL